MNAIKASLARNRLQPVLFISSPTGDAFIFGDREKLKDYSIPANNDGHEITTAGDLLDSLDFEVYEQDEPWICQV